jgi:hypothetical protein
MSSEIRKIGRKKQPGDPPGGSRKGFAESMQFISNVDQKTLNRPVKVEPSSSFHFVLFYLQTEPLPDKIERKKRGLALDR